MRPCSQRSYRPRRRRHALTVAALPTLLLLGFSVDVGSLVEAVYQQPGGSVGGPLAFDEVETTPQRPMARGMGDPYLAVQPASADTSPNNMGYPPMLASDPVSLPRPNDPPPTPSKLVEYDSPGHAPAAELAPAVQVPITVTGPQAEAPAPPSGSSGFPAAQGFTAAGTKGMLGAGLAQAQSVMGSGKLTNNAADLVSLERRRDMVCDAVGGAEDFDRAKFAQHAGAEPFPVAYSIPDGYVRRLYYDPPLNKLPFQSEPVQNVFVRLWRWMTYYRKHKLQNLAEVARLLCDANNHAVNYDTMCTPENRSLLPCKSPVPSALQGLVPRTPFEEQHAIRKWIDCIGGLMKEITDTYK